MPEQFDIELLPPGNRWTVTALLADAVTAENGKLYVLGGGWDHIVASHWPAAVARIGLALIVTVPYMDTNSAHNLTVELFDEDGRPQAIAAGSDNPEAVNVQINCRRRSKTGQ